MDNENYTYLKFLNFSDIKYWTAKRYFVNKLCLSKKYQHVIFGKFLHKYNSKIEHIEDSKQYKIIGVRSYGKGAYINRISSGQNLKMKKYQLTEPNLLLWCKVDTKNGAFGIITSDLANSYASSNMALAKIDNNLIDNEYLQLLFTSNKLQKYLDSFVSGTTNRKYIKIDELLNKIKIPLPRLDEQKEILARYNAKLNLAEDQEKQAKELEENIDKYIIAELGLNINNKIKSKDNYMSFVNFSDITLWGVDKIQNNNFECNKYQLKSFNNNSKFIINAYRGKSPKYAISNDIILNQKCNRWNYIDKQYAKTVSTEWLSKYNEEKTKENDILINSTGEGTIGRATCINKENVNLLYDSHMLLLRLNQNYVYPMYFTYLLNSSFGQAQVNYVKSAQSTKQTELGIDNLKKIKFPYPDIKTQKILVEKITNMQQRSKDLYANAESNRKLALEEFEKELFE